MRKGIASIATAAILMVLAAAPAAMAATEFGDTCTADKAIPGSYTLVTNSSPGSGLPLSAPVTGVITKVKLKSGVPIPFSVPETVKLLRPAGGDSYTAVNQVPVQVTGAEASAETRMPVQVGDKLGVYGPPFQIGESSVAGLALYCDEVPGLLGAALGEVGFGATANFANAAEGRVPLSAVIEPDLDADGFGDETQDKCPQSAALQTPCPVIVLDASPMANKKSVVVYVAVSSEGSVGINGTVNLGKGKKATLKAGPKAVYPGKIASFKLKFSGPLTKRLDELEPSKKLTLKITATATNIAGLVSTDAAKAKLKGQG